MSIPQKSDKITDKDSVFNPKEFTQFKEKLGIKPKINVPEILILCYQKIVLSSIVKNYKLKKIRGFFGDFYQFSNPYNKFSIIGNFGIEGPIVAMLIEEFSYLGVSKFISFGTAGSLQKNLAHGYVIICEGSIRDEGTSFHYLGPEKFVSSSKILLDTLVKAIYSVSNRIVT
ncbi:MAG: Uridine phosphorylase [Candidatus Heimdallarchaeota archaeon LC_3]|nr:MAG: Uridine phosphorylase [Candidatus Heimdallarchaeota archaeon LC_3]